MPLKFQTLAETNIKSFCANTENPTVLLARLTGFLESGIVRPEWCFAAIDPYGGIVARHFWWLRSGSTEPFGIDFVSSEDHTAAVALILHAREQLAVDVAFCQITMPTELGDNPSHVLADLVAVLNDSKFSFEVARVTVEWTSDNTIPLEGARLTYRPACELDDVLPHIHALEYQMLPEVVRLFARGAVRIASTHPRRVLVGPLAVLPEHP